MKPGIAFIGSGFARRVQAPVFKTLGGVDLIGASSPNNAELFAEEFSMPVATADWRKLIRDERVQLVCISSPPFLHFEQALFALENNKHVLCEKPFCLSVKEASILSDKAKTSGCLNLIDHELRFTPAARFLKRQLSEYKLGEIFFVNFESHLTYRNSPDHPFNWWSERKSGGGVWGAIGSHQIDLLRYLVDEITSCSTVLSTGYKKRKDRNGEIHEVTSDDAAAAVFRFRSGAMGNILTTACASENRFDLRIAGEKGTYTMDIDGNVHYISLKGEKEKINIPETTKDEQIRRLIEGSDIANNKFSRAFFYYAAEIIEALNTNSLHVEGAATFEDGLYTQHVLAAGWDQ